MSHGAIVATTAYTDGSVTASDKRAARAGWGVALDLPFNSSDPDQAAAYPGWFGIIDGAQTIGAAELAAI